MCEFGANVSDTKYSAFASWYEEAWRAEEERARARAAARVPTLPGPAHFPEQDQSSYHP